MYNSIKLVYGDFPYFVKDTSTEYTVLGIKPDGTTDDITNDSDLTIVSMDANISLDISENKIYFNKTGSGIVKVYLQENPEYLTDQVEFVVYETFFKDNYTKHLLSDFESQAVEKNTMLKAIMDTCMEYIDILSAFNSDTKLMNDPMRIKTKYLYELGKSMGFENFDNDVINTPLELQANNMYRELLTNLYDLLRKRGTKTAYKLFFGALGYDIDIDEFWWDNEGNLIEIHPEDFVITETNPFGSELSTFYAYDTTGNQIDTPAIPRPDPRNFSDPNNAYNRNNKSNYIRPVLSVRNELGDGIVVENPISFSPKKRAIIRKFLQYLKPIHIQYLQELIKIDLESSDPFSEIIAIPEEIFNYYDIQIFNLVPEEMSFQIAEFIRFELDEFKESEAKIINETMDVYFKWDSTKIVNGTKVPRKWDQDRESIHWDLKDLIFEDFTVQKR